LRKVGAFALAVPVIITVYAVTLLRRSIASRIAVSLAIGSILGLGVLAVVPPSPGVARPASPESTPAPTDFTAAVETGTGLRSPIRISFAAAMDPATVLGAVRLRPETAVRFDWNPEGTLLALTPVDHWTPETLYSVVVEPTARDAGGHPLAAATRWLFLTASSGRGEIVPTRLAGTTAAVDTAFTITLDRPVDPTVAEAALKIEPPVAGRLRLGAYGGGPGVNLVFQPEVELQPDTTYRLSFPGLVDDEGIPFADPPSLEVATATAPAVVRFRPRDRTTGIDQSAAVSVRFTMPMERASTAAAFHVLVNGAEVAGTTSWAEGNTVLVFKPKAKFPYAASVKMTVEGTARSADGTPLVAKSGSFKVEPKPAPPPKPKPISRSSGGGSAVSAAWSGVEAYYLKLMNCTRTGGLVTSSGACSSPGGRNVAPLVLDAGISSKVSRPYARLLATRGICSHYADGDPGYRMRRAGYTNYRWAENLGCRSGNPYSAVLGSHLYFQSERSWSPKGGHYVNLMNPAYDRAGIGVWVSSGRVRLAVDFYHP
jgi:uncharacterized protein YkwD